MGSERVLSAVLSRLRTALRVDGVQLLAGHGVADGSYRPPHLPYASVVGPLAIETEPERSVPNRVVRVRTPGHVLGAVRQAGDLAPGPGTLDVTLDGVTTGAVAIDLGPLAGQAFTATSGGVAVGTQVAANVQAAIRAAATTGVLREDGQGVVDPARLLELGAVTVRWDRVRTRFVVASGRRGPLTGPPADAPPSAVAIAPGPVADALGIAASPAGGGPGAGPGGPGVGPGTGAGTGAGGADAGLVAVSTVGRVTRSRDMAPTAVAIDLRVDLWAGSQAALATMVDSWTAATPLRAEVLLEATPLADDVAREDTSVRLAVGALPRTPSSVLSAGTATAFVDRLAGRVPVLGGGATVGAAGLALGGAGTATYAVIPTPPLPIAWQPHPPGARGWAVETLLRIAPGASDGDMATAVELLAGARSVLALDVALDSDRYVLRARATSATGTPLGATSVSVARAALEGDDAVPVHVLVDAAAGTARVVLDGAVPEDADDPAPGPTATSGDDDVVLRLGDPGGSLDLTLTDVVVHTRPLGQADPRLRTRGPTAVRWPPGSAIYLGTSDDGFTTRGGEFLAYVLGVDGDVIHLDRPVPVAFPRSRTIAHQGSLFVAQRQLRRNDDLMNRIYRVAVEYRVSAFLDDVATAVSAPLVEVPEVDVRELARLLAEEAGNPPPRTPASARIGVGGHIAPGPPEGPPFTTGPGASRGAGPAGPAGPTSVP